MNKWVLSVLGGVITAGIIGFGGAVYGDQQESKVGIQKNKTDIAIVKAELETNIKYILEALRRIEENTSTCD